MLEDNQSKSKSTQKKEKRIRLGGPRAGQEGSRWLGSGLHLHPGAETMTSRSSPIFSPGALTLFDHKMANTSGYCCLLMSQGVFVYLEYAPG